MAPILDRPREEVLARLHVVTRDGVAIRPTLAGLLMFGKYPQEFFRAYDHVCPNYLRHHRGGKATAGARFIDSRRFEGPIPEMVTQAETYVLAAMRKAVLIDNVFRREIPEYPQEALREAIANAVAHRDYSPYVRGATFRFACLPIG